MAAAAPPELNISIDEICDRATAALRELLRNKTVSCDALDKCIVLADVILFAPTYADAQHTWPGGGLTRETLWYIRGRRRDRKQTDRRRTIADCAHGDPAQQSIPAYFHPPH